MTRPEDDDAPWDVDGEDDLETAGALALLADGSEASAALRARLIETVQRTHRWDDLEAEVASLIDLDLDSARALLLAVDEAGGWELGPLPHIELLHFGGGPAVADAITGFVRIPPGETFPHHEHVGDEAVLVLQGELRDSSGAMHARGALLRMAAGTSHSLVVIGAIPLVYLAVVQRGVKIGGEVFGPHDPRA